MIRHETAEHKLERLAVSAAHGDAEAMFFEAGELEQAVLDAWHPLRDGWGELEQRLRVLSRAAGAAYLAARLGKPSPTQLDTARHALERVRSLRLPRRIPRALEVRAPEGYIHYALDPIGYVRAAERYARDVGQEHAARAIVLGVRSIGTSLSGIIAARLAAERGATVRPRGEPGVRRIATDATLRATLLRWLEDGGDALVVDEGPGATGETFQCVAGWLRDLGIAAERIILFPSHLGPPGFGAVGAREFFERSRRYAPPIGDDRAQHICTRFGLSRPRDLSAGRWREVVPDALETTAYPRHERLKYRARDRHGRPFLIRYGGLGPTGAEAVVRAERLESEGLGPEILGRESGFVVSHWVEGRVLRPDDLSSPDFLHTLAAYLRARTSLFPTGRTADVVPIMAMLRENTTEAFGLAPGEMHAELETRPLSAQSALPSTSVDPSSVEQQRSSALALEQPQPSAGRELRAGLGHALRRLERLPPRGATIPDARLQPREWVRTAGGYVKLDAIDHGDGVRLPGPTDPAWDLAGAVVEFGLDAAAQDELVQACGRGAPGGVAGLAAAVNAYRAPYAACQLGEAALGAREAMDESDRRRLEREASRYRRLLWRELGRSADEGAASRPIV